MARSRRNKSHTHVSRSSLDRPVANWSTRTQDPLDQQEILDSRGERSRGPPSEEEANETGPVVYQVKRERRRCVDRRGSDCEKNGPLPEATADAVPAACEPNVQESISQQRSRAKDITVPKHRPGRGIISVVEPPPPSAPHRGSTPPTPHPPWQPEELFSYLAPRRSSTCSRLLVLLKGGGGTPSRSCARVLSSKSSASSSSRVFSRLL